DRPPLDCEQHVVGREIGAVRVVRADLEDGPVPAERAEIDASEQVVQRDLATVPDRLVDLAIRDVASAPDVRVDDGPLLGEEVAIRRRRALHLAVLDRELLAEERSEADPFAGLVGGVRRKTTESEMPLRRRL